MMWYIKGVKDCISVIYQFDNESSFNEFFTSFKVDNDNYIDCTFKGELLGQGIAYEFPSYDESFVICEDDY